MSHVCLLIPLETAPLTHLCNHVNLSVGPNILSSILSELSLPQAAASQQH